jgi:hypothetical protein
MQNEKLWNPDKSGGFFNRFLDKLGMTEDPARDYGGGLFRAGQAGG